MTSIYQTQFLTIDDLTSADLIFIRDQVEMLDRVRGKIPLAYTERWFVVQIFLALQIELYEHSRTQGIKIWVVHITDIGLSTVGRVITD